jgi:hypothetical protein
LGDEHPDTLTAMNNLALFLDEQWRYDEARELYGKRRYDELLRQWLKLHYGLERRLIWFRDAFFG